MVTKRALPSAGRIGIVVSRFNESVTTRLLEGARECLSERGVAERRVDVVWVAGAWELPLAARLLLTSDRHYEALCALGAIVRGETPHFDILATACAGGLMDLQVAYGVPLGFGVLTTDTLEQALARAGGPSGNKGYDAMAAALEAAGLMGPKDERPH